jgi:hypothetical protein
MGLGRYLLRRFGRTVGWFIQRRIARFERACENPESLQADLLLRILNRQRDTAFGRDHHFRSIRSVADFRRHVPIAPYERLAPYIERVAAGETTALLADGPVRLFALTSGTTAARKLIPVTDAYLAAYRRGWNMWGVRMYRDHRPRRLFLRPIVQMVGDPDEYHTPAGIPCGSLSGYTAMVQKRIVRRLYAVPYQTGKLKDPLAKYYVALWSVLAKPVALFMAANPSTLLQLARVLDAEKESLLRDLRDGTLRKDLDLPEEVRAVLTRNLRPDPKRARPLAAVAERTGRLLPSDLWPPETTLVATWTGGSMGPYLRQLPNYFGNAPIRDLGLLASEGRMTIPFANDTAAGVLDVASHYFEFVPEAEIDSASPTVLGAHELAEGGRYFILPTTGYGLYRYHISDVVRVTGFLGRTPMVEFLGKGSRFSNLTGEKLSEYHVTKAVDTVAPRHGQPLGAGYTLAPVWDGAVPHYGFFVEEPDAAAGPRFQAFLAELDAELGRQNIEYAAKRESGRLGPVRAVRLPAGTWATWDAARLAARGGAAEQYKHPCLVGETSFHDEFRSSLAEAGKPD